MARTRVIVGEPKASTKPAYVQQLRQRLLELREQKGVTQKRIAEALRVAEGTYASWERGVFAPRFEQILAIAAYHKVSVDSLVARGKAEPDSATSPVVRWKLVWREPDPALERAAEIWEQFVNGASPVLIGRELGIDRFHLERMVQDLVLSESVEITGVARNEELERAVRQRFKDEDGRPRLRDVWIGSLGHIESSLVRYVLLGYLAKEHFCGEVRQGSSVGLCGGFAVSRMVYALRRGQCPGGIRVFPIAVTPVFEKAGVSANSVVSALAYRHIDSGVQASELPFVYEGINAGYASPPWRIAKRILDDAARVDFVFMGVGGRETGALAKDLTDVQRDYQWLAGVDIGAIQETGQAIGNILYHLIDANGEPLPGFRQRNEQLVCSIGLEGLRRLVDAGKRVIVIASGLEKADITRAAIESRYANVLIVDDELARALVRPGTQRA